MLSENRFKGRLVGLVVTAIVLSACTVQPRVDDRAASSAQSEPAAASAEPTSVVEPTPAPTEIPRITELTFSLGASRADVAQALQGVDLGADGIRAESSGIWVFFDGADAANNIRLDAPFPAEIEGFAISDSLQSLKAAMGEPLREPWSFGANLAHIYERSDGTKVRYDINPSGVIESIFLLA